MTLRISDALDVAVSVGMWRPAVLLPRPWIESRSPEELRKVLAHSEAAAGEF